MNAWLSVQEVDEIILGIFRNIAFAFFIIIDSRLSLLDVWPLKDIEIFISIACIFKLDAGFSALYFWEERLVAVCVALHPK